MQSARSSAVAIGAEESGAAEPAVAAALREFLRSQANDDRYIDAQVRELFDDGGFRSRFEYFMPLFDEGAKRHLLISGTAVGTEMLLAMNYGFRQVAGTEVVPELVAICARRIAGCRGMNVEWYDGGALPFADGIFSAIVSGHVIEHTRSPRTYLSEHLRVLEAGGSMFLEFPTRYHRTELHTGLPSVEWLPKIMRALVIRLAISRMSPLSDGVKERYRAILETLQPVSVWQVRCWARRLGWRIQIKDCSVPVAGIVRLVIRKS